MRGVPMRALIGALILLPAAVLSTYLTSNALNVKPVIGETTLPETIGPWKSTKIPLTDAELTMLDSPAASQRVYFDDDSGAQIQVLLLQVSNTQNAHDPKLCMVGSGYELAEDKVVPSPWGKYPVSRAVFRRGSTEVVMYYWLQTPTGTIADMSAGLKLEGMKQAIRGNLVRGVAVRVMTLTNSIVPDLPTDPKLAEDLWVSLRAEIGFDELIAGM